MEKKSKERLKQKKKYKLFDVQKVKETLPNRKSYDVYEFEKSLAILNTDNFKEVVVPNESFFVLGDNRDNSQDSRFLGFIPKENLVGRAELVFLSFDVEIGSFIKFWTWYSALRKDRFFVSLLPDKDD